MPVSVHIKENPAGFHRLDAVWTPTVVMLDENGKERFRLEGYLPKDEFMAQLRLGLARLAFMNKKWEQAEQIYREIVQKHPNTSAAPEAVYWAAVSNYKHTNDHHVLGDVPKVLQQKYPDSIWANKAIPWAS